MNFNKKDKRPLLLLIIVLLLNFVLSLFNLGERILSGDEARITIKSIWILRGLSNLVKLNITKDTFFSFYGIFAHTHVPMVLFIPLPFLLFSVNEVTARLAYVLVGSATLAFCFFVFKKELSLKLAFVISLFLACSSLIIGWSRWADCPIIEVLMTGLLTYFLYLFVQFQKKSYFYWLMIIYTICLFTIISFFAYLPIIIFYVSKSWKKFTLKEKLGGLLIPLSTAGLFYLIWLGISLFYLSGSLGLRYVLFERMKMAGSFWSTLKYFINQFIFDINIIFWIPFIALALRRFFRDKLVEISTVICLTYIIFFFFLRSERPYLYHIYLPLIFLGIKGVEFFKQKLMIFIFSLFAIINFLLIIYFLNNGNYRTDLVWSFGYQKQAVKEIGLIIRTCLDPQDKYISDNDYYLTDYYFNRRYPIESDRLGIEKAIFSYKTLGVKAIVLSDEFLKLQSEIKVFLNKNSFSQKHFFDKKTLYLMKECAIINVSNPEKLFDKKYGYFWTIIDFKR